MVKSNKAVKLNIKEISNEKSNIMQENLHGMRHFNHIRQGFEIRSFLSLMIYLVSNLKHIEGQCPSADNMLVASSACGN